MFDLHEVVVIDGSAFTKGLLFHLFSHSRMRNRVEPLAVLNDLHLLSDERIKSLDPSVIVFNYQSCTQDIERILL